MKECKDYPRVLIFLVNIINNFILVFAISQYFLFYYVMIGHYPVRNIIALIIFVIMLILYGIFANKMKKRYCNGEISLKSYIYLMIASIFAIAFLTITNCGFVGAVYIR